MNLAYLECKIKEINIPKSTIAKKMGISRQALYMKMKGDIEFKASEMESLCEILRLTAAEKSTIFFADEVYKNGN